MKLFRISLLILFMFSINITAEEFTLQPGQKIIIPMKVYGRENKKLAPYIALAYLLIFIL